MIDLANEVIRETYKPGHKNNLESMSLRTALSVREAMQTARRFVLDESMSEMLGHLSSAPYEEPADVDKVLESARRSSRLPFPKMFVQYDGKAFRRGLINVKPDSHDLW